MLLLLIMAVLLCTCREEGSDGGGEDHAKKERVNKLWSSFKSDTSVPALRRKARYLLEEVAHILLIQSCNLFILKVSVVAGHEVMCGHPPPSLSLGTLCAYVVM